MNNLDTWLADCLRMIKRSDAVTTAALPQIENMSAEAARYLPLHPKQNPMLATAFPRYTAAQGLKDIPTGVGRMAAETARAILPGMGHAGGNSVGDNLINHGGRAAWGTFVGAPLEGVAGFARGIGGGKGFMGALDEGANAYTKDLNMAWQPVTGAGMFGAADRPLQGLGAMFVAPFERAMADPNGMRRSIRETTGLFDRWQPELLGDTLAHRVTSIAPGLPQSWGGGGVIPPFWRNWLGVENGIWNQPVTKTYEEQSKLIHDMSTTPGPGNTRIPGTAFQSRNDLGTARPWGSY